MMLRTFTMFLSRLPPCALLGADSDCCAGVGTGGVSLLGSGCTGPLLRKVSLAALLVPSAPAWRSVGLRALSCMLC